MAEEKNIGLRSEKVRNVVGRIPPAVDRYGIMVIGLVLTVLMLVSMLIPYKETARFIVRFDPQSKTEGVSYLDKQQAVFLHEGKPVSIMVKGETVEGMVVSVSEKRINGKYEVHIKLSENDEITVAEELNAEVVVMEKSWFEAIRGR